MSPEAWYSYENLNLKCTAEWMYIHNIYMNIYVCVYASIKRWIYMPMIPSLWGFDLQFFDFMVVWKWYTFIRNHISDFEFWSFPGLAYLFPYSLVMLSVAATAATAAASHEVTRINSWYIYNHSVPTQLFCFSLSVQFSIHYMRYSTLYCKIGFVLDNFAQL